MSKFCKSLVALLVLGAAPLARASSFGPGEQTVLRVDYSGIKAGTATITVGGPSKQGETTVWPIVTLADSAALFSVFPLHDKFVSWWDPGSSRSVGWDFTANENKKSRRERVRLNAPASGKAQISRADEAHQEQQTADIDPSAQDIAAAFFTLRQQDLQPGADVKIPVFTGKHSWDMTAKVGQPEPLKVDAGRFEALPMDVEVHFQGKLQSNRSLKVWVSNDAHHALLKMQADLALGSINAEAVEYHPGVATEEHASVP